MIQISWSFWKSFSDDFRICNKVVRILVREGMHELKEKVFFVGCGWRICPSSYHATDERYLSPIIFLNHINRWLGNSFETLIEVVPTRSSLVPSKHIIPSIIGIKNLMTSFRQEFWRSDIIAVPATCPVGDNDILVKSAIGSITIVVDSVIKGHWFHLVFFHNSC